VPDPLSRFRVESTLSAFTMDEKLTKKDPKTLLYWRLKPGYVTPAIRRLVGLTKKARTSAAATAIAPPQPNSFGSGTVS
jgi:hypothetical protein